MATSKAIFAPKYIPAETMRKMTKDQLKLIATQKNTRGKFSQNALNAQKILWRTKGYFSKHWNGLNMHERTGWDIPTDETVDIEPWLNGTEVVNETETLY